MNSSVSSVTEVAESKYPDRWDSERIIAHVHQLGRELGLTRERMDRHRYPSGQYFEVGYGPILTVTVRTSWGDKWIVTRENYRPTKFYDLIELLVSESTEDAAAVRVRTGVGSE